MNTEKKKFKLNALDIVILVVIVLILAFLAYKFLLKGDSFSAETMDVTYRIKVENVDRETLDSILTVDTPTNLLAGDTLVDYARVTKIEYTDATSGVEFYEEEGNLRIRYPEDKVDVIFTIEATVTDQANVEVSTQEMRIGKVNYYLKTKYYEFIGSVLSCEYN